MKTPAFHAITYLLLIFLLAALPQAAQAQRFDLGTAAVYGDDIDQLGVNARFYVNSSDHRFCFGPELSWFPTHTEQHDDEEISKQLTEFNPDYSLEIVMRS